MAYRLFPFIENFEIKKADTIESIQENVKEMIEDLDTQDNVDHYMLNGIEFYNFDTEEMEITEFEYNNHKYVMNLSITRKD